MLKWIRHRILTEKQAAVYFHSITVNLDSKNLTAIAMEKVHISFWVLFFSYDLFEEKIKMNHIIYMVWSKQQQIINFSVIIQYNNINTNNWYCINYYYLLTVDRYNLWDLLQIWLGNNNAVARLKTMIFFFLLISIIINIIIFYYYHREKSSTIIKDFNGVPCVQ